MDTWLEQRFPDFADKNTGHSAKDILKLKYYLLDIRKSNLAGPPRIFSGIPTLVESKFEPNHKGLECHAKRFTLSAPESNEEPLMGFI